MSMFLRLRATRSTFTRPFRGIHAKGSRISTRSRNFEVLATSSVALSLFASYTLYQSRYPVLLDAAGPEKNEDVRIDPATSIEFPRSLFIPSRIGIPRLSLVGLGVRKVSFLGVKVYSVALYADLQNLSLDPSLKTPEEKLRHIVDNQACVLRIVPTRSTSYSHLRDGFMRALQSRILLLRKNGQLSEEDEAAAQASLRKLKSVFPNTSMVKHTPLDIMVMPRRSSTAPGKRGLVVRDLGAVESDLVAREFVLAYFEGDGISPPLKETVWETLESLT